MRKQLGLLMGMYAMSAMANAEEHQEFMREISKPIQKKRRKEIDFSRKIDEVIPNGVKEYWFDIFGEFKNEPLLEYYYKCFALNDKNAKRKFDAYRKRYRGQ